jgi:hypothetical protein
MRDIAEALDRNFTSPNECDQNGEQANVAGALFEISRALWAIAKEMEQQRLCKSPSDFS